MKNRDRNLRVIYSNSRSNKMNKQNCISEADFARLCHGDVTPDEKKAILDHVEVCAECRENWQQVSAGAQHVQSLLFKAAGKTKETLRCLSEDQIRQYIADTLDQHSRQIADRHLDRCSKCRDAVALKYAEAYEKEGGAWWNRYVEEQLLSLLSLLPQAELNEIIGELETAPSQSDISGQIIRLPILEPASGEAMRLAAATGKGFSSQTIRQDDPAFEIELVQFGEQLRMTIRSLAEDSSQKECLARVNFLEQDRCRLSMVVLIEDGQGRCIVQSDEVRKLKLDKESLSLRVELVDTIAKLAEAGPEAYVPILERLLRHEDPNIRRSAVAVTARICGPKSRPLIEPLSNDKDESVRSAVKKALDQFPGL
jgi:hypothetical protein